MSGTLTYLTRSPEVIEGRTFYNFTILMLHELVNTFVMLTRLVCMNKQCVPFQGQVVTSNGHCKVKRSSLRSHRLVTPLREASDERDSMVH